MLFILCANLQGVNRFAYSLCRHNIEMNDRFLNILTQQVLSTLILTIHVGKISRVIVLGRGTKFNHKSIPKHIL